MQAIFDLGIFVLKVSVIAIALAWLVAVIFKQTRALHLTEKRIVVRKYQKSLEKVSRPLREASLSPLERKTLLSQRKKARKAEKSAGPSERNRLWVLDFSGDINASSVEELKDEITATLQVARPSDEVMVRINSSGGTVVGYGLGAAHLERIKKAGLRLTTTVDKVAASGGYMMASVGDTIVSAPFAIIGSIGVIATVPNIRPFLDDKGVRVLEVTAGEYKRTVTPFSDVTPDRVAKLEEQLSDVHELFKNHVAQHRPQLDVERVATGEYWYGEHALTLGLVDQVLTSDEWLLGRSANFDIYLVRTVKPGAKVIQSMERLGSAISKALIGKRVIESDVTDLHRLS